MTRYSVVAAKGNLADLINKALAGEEVVITRRGKPAVTMCAVDLEPKPLADDRNPRS